MDLTIRPWAQIPRFFSTFTKRLLVFSASLQLSLKTPEIAKSAFSVFAEMQQFLEGAPHNSRKIIHIDVLYQKVFGTEITEVILFSKFLLTTSCILILTSCGSRLLTKRETNPVTEDYIRRESIVGDSDLAVLSTRPDRRSVFINLQKNNPEKYLDICAEPSADVAEAFASSQAAASGGKLPDGSELNVSASSSLSTAVAQLTRRSQGLQFMRDQMFYLCVERVNGTISAAQYAQMRAEVIRLGTNMVNLEMSRLPSNLASIAAIASSEAKIAESQAKSSAGASDQGKEKDK